VTRLGNVDHSFVAGNSAKAAEATANVHQHGMTWPGGDVLLSLEGVPERHWGNHDFTSELLKTVCIFGQSEGAQEGLQLGSAARTVGSHHL
jgi:hypothetical protein